MDPRVEFAQRTSTATNHWRQAVSSKRERYHAPQTAPVRFIEGVYILPK